MRGTASRSWAVGQVAVLRYITRTGQPGMSWPCRVVEDRDDLLALYIPRGATYMRWEVGDDGRRRLGAGRWREDVLRLMFPGQPYSIWLFFREREHGQAFSGYYINMEEPFRRTPIGFDTNDHTLDVVVDTTLAWRWKDEDEFAERVRQGIYNAEFAEETRARATQVIEALERRAPPFSDGWDRWTPDVAWGPLTMPTAWDQEPATLWERRHWAYGDANP